MIARCHTFTGQGFDPFNPDPRDVRLDDIAHHLSMMGRYGGAAPVFYSVAKHAMMVAIVWRITKNASWTLWALHHDSPEAYIGDIRRPIKQAIPDFSELETKVWCAIETGLDLPQLGDELKACTDLIHEADDMALAAEMETFFDKSRRSAFLRGHLVGPPRLEATIPFVDRADFLHYHNHMKGLL